MWTPLEKAGPRVWMLSGRVVTWKNLQVCLIMKEKLSLCMSLCVSVCLTIILFKEEEKILCSNFSSSVL